MDRQNERGKGGRSVEGRQAAKENKWENIDFGSFWPWEENGLGWVGEVGVPSLGKEEEGEGKGGFQIPLKGGEGKPLKGGGRGRRGQMVPKEILPPRSRG